MVAPSVAWLQLAPELTCDELVVAGDFLVCRKYATTTIPALEELLDSSVGVRGVRRAREAFADIRAGTDSPRESFLRLLLVRSGLPEPVVHHAVYDADGFWVGTPDLAFVAERIAIEYEGSGHWEDQDTFEDDILRRELFRRAGWVVVQVTGRRMSNPASLLGEIEALLRERSR